MSLPSKVIVITGANRGLGWEFVNQLLFTPTPPHILLTKEQFCNNDYTIVALSRSIDGKQWSELQDKLTAFNTANGSNRKLKTVQCDVTNLTEIKSLTELIKTELNNRVDIFIANAGIAENSEKEVRSVRGMVDFDTDVEKVFKVNTIAPVISTNLLAPFLINAAKSVAKLHGIDLDTAEEVANKDDDTTKKTDDVTKKNLQYSQSVYVSSIMGSITCTTMPRLATYRASKTALNMYIKTLSCEYPIINFIPLHPGWVATDMGGTSAPVTPVDSIRGMLNVMDTNCYQAISGTVMIEYDGKQLPW